METFFDNFGARSHAHRIWITMYLKYVSYGWKYAQIQMYSEHNDPVSMIIAICHIRRLVTSWPTKRHQTIGNYWKDKAAAILS